jgi:hypothetical protein
VLLSNRSADGPLEITTRTAHLLGRRAIKLRRTMSSGLLYSMPSMATCTVKALLPSSQDARQGVVAP